MAEVTIRALADAGALSFSDGYRTKRSEHGTPGYRILRVADVANGRVDLDGPDFVSEQHLRAIGAKLSEPGDVLLTTKGTVGRVAIYPEDAERAVYSPQLCYFRVADREVIDARYLSYWFKSDAFVRQASHRANNTDMAAYINLRDIASLTIDLPEIEEQRAVAEVLSALDDKILANGRTVTVADELAEAHTRRAFSGEVVRLADVADVTMGSSPPGSSYNEASIGLPFYQGVRDFGVRVPSNRIWTDAPVRRAEAGDTLLSVRAPVGRTNLADEEICIGRGLAALRARDGRAMTLFHQIRAAHAAWAPYEAEGTVFGAINRAQLEGIELPALKSDEASELEFCVTALENVIASALRETDTLTRTRDELLPLLMSGKVRVKDAEKTVEGVL